MPPKQYVLVLVTANNCGHCHALLATDWSTIKGDIAANFPNISIEHISKPSMDTPMESLTSANGRAYPKILNNWVRRFPTLMIFRQEDWANGRLGASTPFFIYQGQIVNGFHEPIIGAVGVKPVVVKDWIRQSIKQL